jgi:pimeloyl-ACP methyl ester carboxylesterase
VTLVFLHGAGFGGDVFAAQTAEFEASHAPNLPGHFCPGQPQTVDEFAAFVAEYVHRNDLRDVVLCGHSLGGAIAIQTALDRAVPLRALVLLASGAKLRVAPAFLKGFESDFRATAREVASYFFAEPAPARIAWAADCMERVGPAQTLRDFRACDAFDALERLGEISVPVLALTGEADKMTPPKFAHALADRVPGAQARIIAGAGHFVMVEQPDETNEAIRACLSGIV